MVYFLLIILYRKQYNYGFIAFAQKILIKFEKTLKITYIKALMFLDFHCLSFKWLLWGLLAALQREQPSTFLHFRFCKQNKWSPLMYDFDWNVIFNSWTNRLYYWCKCSTTIYKMLHKELWIDIQSSYCRKIDQITGKLEMKFSAWKPPHIILGNTD